MNWKGLLGGVAVGVGTTLKDRADAAQKERLTELAFAKEQLLKREDNTFRASEAEKARTFDASQTDVKLTRSFENDKALLGVKNEYDAPTREADIAAKRANAEESRARAKYYGEGGGSPGGRVSTPAAIQKADAMVEAARMSNPNLTPEEEANIRMIALGGAPSARDDARAFDSLFKDLLKENPRLPDGRRLKEIPIEEQVSYGRQIIGLRSGQQPAQKAAAAAPASGAARVVDVVIGPDGKLVIKR